MMRLRLPDKRSWPYHTLMSNSFNVPSPVAPYVTREEEFAREEIARGIDVVMVSLIDYGYNWGSSYTGIVY